ncbi:MAG TPA: pyruvate kinase [Anaerolineales bacterium]|nr:pyruvate kinase [Anaerolineales bacterium]
MENYPITATLGPASSIEAVWRAMLSAGATGFRLNTSHLELEQLWAWLERLEPFLSACQPRPALTLDLQGSKWRLGHFAPLELSAGQVVELVLAPSSDQPGRLPVPHADFFQAAPISSPELRLNDARVHLQVESIAAERLLARVTRPGRLSAHKGITYLDSGFRSETLSEKDEQIIRQANELPGICYAISYLRDAAEMRRYRAWLGPQAYLVAKLERAQAVAEAKQIALDANELWVCRGDLGAELGLPGMARAVHNISGLVHRLACPVLMAGQVLEHMTAGDGPTRAEVCALHDALALGYRGFVLSDETAIGQHPVEACQAAAMFRAEG